MVCDTEASSAPPTSISAPRQMVVRPPKRRITKLGSGLDNPQAMPSSEKLNPASVIDQCRSPTMLNSTTPKVAKVPRLSRKKAADKAANTVHFPIIERPLFRPAILGL